MATTKKYKYQARKGFRITDEQADLIGQTVDGLEKKTATELLKVATSKKHPLHDLYEWDNNKAAQKHRLDQSRYYMRSFAITEIEIDNEPVKARHAIEFDEEPEREYISHERVIASPSMMEQKSVEYYGQIRAICQKAAGLGFRTIPQWKTIIDTVLKNNPTS